jgi:hypothetical protein
VAHAPTAARPPSSPRWFATLAAGALLLAGCGLADYEGRMSSEAARVQRWDEEDKQLGAPIKMPELPKRDGKEQSWNVFLRLPRNVGDTPATEPNSKQAQLYGGLLAQYGGGSGMPFVFLGVGEQKDYATTVLSKFPTSPPAFETVVVKGPSHEVALKRKTFDDANWSYSANFSEHGNVTVAVIYCMDKGAGSRFSRAIELSLATLAQGDEANRSGGAYPKTHQKPRR